MKIENIHIDKIIPYWNNARDNQKAIKPVEESIKQYGFQQPLVLDTNYEIICGHTRYFALKNLGHKVVPCIIADLPAEKAKQYRIADNKTSEFAKWDEDKLIRELRTMDIPTDMQPFFFEPVDQLLGFENLFTPQVPDTPTGETIQETPENQEKQTAAFEQKIEKAQEQLNQEATEYIELACPHCGETIRMKK